MSPLIAQLSKYASYHRDPRNISTHFVGVPMIVIAVIALLTRPGFELGGVALSPAWLALIAATAFYLRLDLRYGLAMGGLLGLALFLASLTAGLSTAAWLGLSVGLFVVGWIIQFIGHYFEGRKPAFVDDLIGLLVGPLFVAAEIGFSFGLRKEVKAEIEQIAGPTRLRDTAQKSA
ncbi:MAG: DUF962 domain-containing protein [Myxococcota bacterium]